MTNRPDPTWIYHITHVENLPSILADEGLYSDAAMTSRGGPKLAVGMSEIKQNRMQYPVSCHPGDIVGEYVPFYFCPRSIMLYLLHMGNHPGLNCRGGQGPIIHLQANIFRAVEWANSAGVQWAFSLTNAGARYAPFRSDLAQLNEINWAAVTATDFRPPEVKEGKQAEFLVRQFFPWRLVERIGVHSSQRRDQVLASLDKTPHKPPVDVLDDWYF